MNLEYKATFKESDLVSDIVRSMRNHYPDLSLFMCRELARVSLRNLRKLGNQALYDGLVKLATEQAETKLYLESL